MADFFFFFLGNRNRGVTANPYYLGSAGEEVQYPTAECGAQAQSDMFSNQLHGWDQLKAELESTNCILT